MQTQDLTPTEAQALAEAEAVIGAGLKTTWAVAQALHAISKGRLYRASHSSFEAYLDDRWGIGRAYGHRLVSAGVVLAELAEAKVSPTGDIPERHLRELGRAPEGERAAVYVEATARANGEPTAAHVRDVVEEKRASFFDDPAAVAAWKAGGNTGARREAEPDDETEWVAALGGEPDAPIVDRTGNVGRMAATDETTDNWHTPDDVLDLAREILGGIDTDPASCREAQDRVRAGRWFGPVEDGLSWPWQGRVWLNPPFSAIADWAFAATERLLSPDGPDAILLCCHANTDAAWWHNLRGFPVALSRGRVRYLRPGGERGESPPRGTALFLLGGDYDTERRFAEVLRGAGWDVRAPLGWRP